MKDQLDTVKELIANNQTNEALVVLLKLCGSNQEIEKTVLTTMAEYSGLQLQINQGTIQIEEAERRKSQIRIRTLENADMLFRLNNKHVISAVNNQLIIKEKKLNSIEILAKMTIGFLLIALIFYLLIELWIGNEGLMADVCSSIQFTCLFGGIGSFIGLIFALVVNAIKN